MEKIHIVICVGGIILAIGAPIVHYVGNELTKHKENDKE